jgi:hypothetical protein
MVDIEAKRDYYSLILQSDENEGKVFAFEPATSNYEWLMRHRLMTSVIISPIKSDFR